MTLRPDVLPDNLEFHSISADIHIMGIVWESRLASDTNTELLAVVLANVLDEISSMLEIVVSRNPVLFSSRWISSEGQDVVHAEQSRALFSIRQFSL